MMIAGKNSFVILSNNLWQRQFKSDPNILGHLIMLDRPDAAAHEGPHAAPTNWMEDITQDTRGYIYADDDKWGIWILRDPNQK